MKRTHEKGKIVHRGMGGFLCPPGHPMLTMSVETDLRRKPENRGSMALDYAAKCEYLDARRGPPPAQSWRHGVGRRWTRPKSRNGFSRC